MVAKLTDKQEPTADEIAKNFDQTRDQLLQQRRAEAFNVFMSGVLDDYKKHNRIRMNAKAQTAAAAGHVSRKRIRTEPIRKARSHHGCGPFLRLSPMLLYRRPDRLERQPGHRPAHRVCASRFGATDAPLNVAGATVTFHPSKTTSASSPLKSLDMLLQW